jgi:hypothetical protein
MAKQIQNAKDKDQAYSGDNGNNSMTDIIINKSFFFPKESELEEKRTKLIARKIEAQKLFQMQ